MVQKPGVLGHVRRMFRRHELQAHDDGQLLDAFLTDCEPAAFAVLVERLGPMVLGVCRRLTLQPHDAEDAFQATFLVLLRKARSIQPRARVGCWLYGVACRTAREVRRLAQRRRTRERQVETLPERAVSPESMNEMAPWLDRELERLPAKYRLPILLCDLQGKMHKEAAELLGWPQGTLSGRLTRARQELARRLTARGLPCATAVAGAVWTGPASASVPPELAATTANAASALLADGQKALFASPVYLVAQGVLRAMFWSRILKFAIITIAALAFVAGSGVVLHAWAPFGGADQRPRTTDGSGASSSSSSPESSSSASPAQKAKRMELNEAEKLVRKDIYEKNPDMNPNATFPLIEITTDEVWKGLQTQVFKVKGNVLGNESYVIRNGKVSHIGQGFGGFGVSSLGVADLDKSGHPLLVYVFSWGSGIHRAHIGAFDVAAKEPVQFVAPQVYFSERIEDPVLTFNEDQTVDVKVGDQKLGRLAIEKKDGERKLRLILDEKLPDEVRSRIRGEK
jgi:RNA polymerase sigma factor (sigma-70 family)